MIDARIRSVFPPAGGVADRVDGHLQLLLVAGSVVWVIVVTAMFVAVLRRRRAERTEGDDGVPGDEPGRGHLVVAFLGGVAPAVIILGVMADSVLTLRDTGGTADASRAPVVVEVDGRQFWWEVRYPEHDVETANEIHIPTGQDVRVELTSDDVIHSFWVPQLAGKVDLVPGRTNVVTLHADEPGTYWGRCAEYCGLQHAWMRFVVVAHDEPEYAGWLEAQGRPAESPGRTDDGAGGPDGGDETAGGARPGAGPDTEEVAAGREIFMSSSCVYCHTIAGTEARGTLGPDLTHLASRQMIGAGVLPNDRESLARWITGPQDVKPGNAMPGTDLSEDELDALITYLESLE
ncbi:cytochrome c oxidase subunit II [Myceligenerans pegani]|uniref:Cytochrome aa3 subunit 2 n=1 Tax=Myceligenerans pegani TaxID=2776917 RepID=A0ABR9MV21_9MICO|nr:cytochrome c oxidase subunit II [Myceligenerans sp. TRM 65318]MBE1874886.1 cytochrome c oxidase subunit II [Myceligenerans sp. TRM 65318]MBE3017157.1 cytochrome c oxidase subunit II [Myceligenerans sp. TRM 65318]